MEIRNQKEDFCFTYSAKEQEEVKRIREKYQPQKEDKMTRLRELDASVTKKATMISIIVGTIGALVLGSGMSLVMTNLGEMVGLQKTVGIVIGIIIGIIGIIFVSLAYPLYYSILKKERERIAPEILRLADDLIK